MLFFSSARRLFLTLVLLYRLVEQSSKTYRLIDRKMNNDKERRAASGRSSSQPRPHTSPYEYTKTGLIGDQRDTMLQSELQILVSPHLECLSFVQPAILF